jgi:transcriptional regulator with XRE-family HTH domain
MGVGKNIKRVRILRGVTQEELAEKSGVSVGQIRDYEYERAGYIPRTQTLDKISTALDIDGAYLIDPFMYREERIGTTLLDGSSSILSVILKLTEHTGGTLRVGKNRITLDFGGGEDKWNSTDSLMYNWFLAIQEYDKKLKSAKTEVEKIEALLEYELALASLVSVNDRPDLSEGRKLTAMKVSIPTGSGRLFDDTRGVKKVLAQIEEERKSEG